MTQIPSIEEFERLGVFYLGRRYDLSSATLQEDLLLYDAKDLCTHALCVGMTGSGKTGLCLAMLEEAAIDGIPILCVDPKGDLSNLLLSFPELRSEDFRPWLEPGEAARQGKTLDELAEVTATRWREGLARWGQSGERVRRFRESADVAVYTPGSSAGLPLTVLRSFAAPPVQVLDDADAFRERVSGAASGLLTLLGIDADPLLSREHILLSTILDKCWREGRDVAIADLINLIQSPPVDRVGVLDINSFMPADARASLAMRLNNMLASPAFSAWLEGEALDVQRLLYDAAGKPRISIISIAHLSDSERMFFVTILLNELVSWMRAQSGTSSLRAIFYMDEIFGYFPPSANPPSKAPMMTLLKQARAFGLGIALATQNPVDLDYKGLANIGTWFLGRLQTERDKMRVLEGLEGAALQAGQGFDRQQMERTLSALGNRVFLMNNVHDDQPTIFQTRWALSFLAGPLARDKISLLMRQRKEQVPARQGEPQENRRVAVSAKPARPVVPVGITELFVVPQRAPQLEHNTLYRAVIFGKGSLHYVRANAGIDLWRDEIRFVDCSSINCSNSHIEQLWEASSEVDQMWQTERAPRSEFTFVELPVAFCSADNYKRWERELKDFLYRHCAITIYRSPLLKSFAPGIMSEADARIYFAQAARELRDRESEKVRSQFTKRMETLDQRLRAAQEKLAKEQLDLKEVSVTSVVGLGQSILGALLGNKRRRSATSKAKDAVQAATRAAKERDDVLRAEESLKELSLNMVEMDNEFRAELRRIGDEFAAERLELEPISIAARKGDLKVETPILVWTPWQQDKQGNASPLF